MVIESEIEQKGQNSNYGGARTNAGRKPLFEGYSETSQKYISLPPELWRDLQMAYAEHGRSWASVGVYELIQKWRSENDMT